MRSLFENKRLILLLAALALGALTVLAISLNQVPFREGQHFAREERPGIPLPPPEVSQEFIEVPILQQIMVLVLLAVLIGLIFLMLSPERRKRFIKMLIRVALTVWAVYFLLKNYGNQLLGLNLERGNEGPAADPSTVPMPTFEPPQVSPTVSYLLSFIFAFLFLTVLWVLYRGWQRYRILNKVRPLDEIARIARSSLNELSSGRNSSDVIINCYLRMSDVVSNRRQLHRAVAMTPHEFALRLEQAGLPGDAVNRLTHLFEGVRYGDRKSGPRDVNEAVSCLKTILHYCGELV